VLFPFVLNGKKFLEVSMKQLKLRGILGAALVFCFFITSCEQPTAEALSSNANLSKVAIAGADVLLPVPAHYWDAEELDAPAIVLEELDQIAVNAVPAEAGAYVYYAKASGDETPVFVETSTFGFEDEDYLYIEVFSPNKDTVLFYKYQLLIPSDVATVDRVTLAGVSAYRGTPAAAWNDAGLEEGLINLTVAQAADVKPAVIKANKSRLITARTSNSPRLPALGNLHSVVIPRSLLHKVISSILARQLPTGPLPRFIKYGPISVIWRI
jgi:hypothetical protein